MQSQFHSINTPTHKQFSLTKCSLSEADSIASISFLYVFLEILRQEVGPSEWPFKLVGDNSSTPRLKKGKQRKPDPCAFRVVLHEGTIVGQCVVVEEEAGGEVEGDKDINGVVFMGCQDEEDAKQVQRPAEGVE